MGIAIDILVVLFLIWSLIRGWRMGFLYQLGILAFLVVAYFAARGLASLLAKPVAKMIAMSPLVAGTLTFFVLFFLLGIIGAIIVRRITKDMIPDSSALSPINRFLGAIVSLAKGALIAYLAIVLLLQIQRVAGNVPFPWQSSIAARFAHEHDFLDHGAPGALANLVWLAATTRDVTQLAQEPHAQQLMANPKTRALLTPEVLGALNNEDYVTLLRNDALWDFLEDPTVQASLSEWVESRGNQPAQALPPASH